MHYMKTLKSYSVVSLDYTKHWDIGGVGNSSTPNPQTKRLSHIIIMHHLAYDIIIFLNTA